MARPEFVELDLLRDPDGMGLIAPITKCDKPTGYTAFSFSIFKEFQRSEGGPVERTTYLNDRHIDAARKLLDMVQQRIATERDRMHARRRASSRGR